jgi:Ca2+-transporting ATPase
MPEKFASPSNATSKDGKDAAETELPDSQLEDLLTRFRTSRFDGLTREIAVQRLKEVGENKISAQKQRPSLLIFFDQFRSSVVFLLLGAAVISFLTHEYMQMAGILVAVFINAGVGFATEYKSLVSLQSLEQLTGPVSRVKRSGSEYELPASQLVPGDLVILEAGCQVPADIKLFQAANLAVDESFLSGEPLAVYKNVESQDRGESKQASVVLQGSLVLSGRGKGIVFATGDQSILGKLGREVQGIHTIATPLEKDLEHLGNVLTLMTIYICAGIFLIGSLQHRNILDMLQISITLAVAAIPEGLPVIATLALAIGTNRMMRANALTRKLSAVETLGCAQIICTDKTGTITQNKMSVSDIVIFNQRFQVSGLGYSPEGQIKKNGRSIEVKTIPALDKLLETVCLCNDARLEAHADATEGWHVHGNPTEGALLTAAARAGMDERTVREQNPRVKEFPFDSRRKRMTTIHTTAGNVCTARVKGSVESILASSAVYYSEDGFKKLDEKTRRWFLEAGQEMAAQGKRVLAVATREFTNEVVDEQSCSRDLILLGLVAMSDQLRPGVAHAVNQCQRAGIKVIMITGDHQLTAAAVAEEAGIRKNETELSLTGDEYESMDTEERCEAWKKLSVIARTKPDTKLAIVRDLQSLGQVVAMTGDGVNDAAALRQADIGIAMGASGTALSREASDMVITDDNFATIVQAIKQGRLIYGSIARTIAYLLTASLTSVLAVAVTIIAGEQLLLSPMQLLWLNLIMHIFPGLGLVLHKGTSDVMNRPPRQQHERLLGRHQIIQITLRSIIVTAAAIAASYYNPSHAGTILFSTMSLALLLQSWSWLQQSDDQMVANLLQRECFAMWLNSLIGLGLLLAAMFFTPLRTILGMQLLTGAELLVVVTLALTSYLVSGFLRPAKS